MVSHRTSFAGRGPSSYFMRHFFPLSLLSLRGSYLLKIKPDNSCTEYEGYLNIEKLVNYFKSNFRNIAPENIRLYRDESAFIKITHPVSILYGALANIFCVFEKTIPITDGKEFAIGSCFVSPHQVTKSYLVRRINRPLTFPNEQYRFGVYVICSSATIKINLRENSSKKFHEIHGKNINVRPKEVLVISGDMFMSVVDSIVPKETINIFKLRVLKKKKLNAPSKPLTYKGIDYISVGNFIESKPFLVNFHSNKTFRLGKN